MTMLLPGPDGTNGDYWLGDTVTLHTGASSRDYAEAHMRVVAITVAREDDNAELVVLPELRSLPPVPEEFGIWDYAEGRAMGEPLVLTFEAGNPPDGLLVVSFVASRVTGGDGTGWTEGNTGLIYPVDPTGWGQYGNDSTRLGICAVQASGISIYPGAMFTTLTSGAYTPYYGWIDGGSTNGPHGHAIAVTGLATTPDDVWSASAQTSSPSRATTGDMTCSGPGVFFIGFDTDAHYPDDTEFTNLTEGAVELGHLESEGAFPPTPASWFGYLQVDSAGTYEVGVDFNSSGKFGFVAAFFPALP